MLCLICKKNNFEKIYSLKTKNILHCKNDGLIVAEKTKEDNTYGKEYFSNEPNKFNQSYFLNKLTSIKRLIKVDKPKILDIGCGWGNFEEVLEAEKIPYLGIDINKEAIKICRKQGLNCKLSTIAELIKGSNDSGVVAPLRGTPPQNDVILVSEGRARPESKNKFDCISLFQVIEHIQNPVSLLQSAKKLIKPKGVILITTPNNDSPLRKIMGAKWSVYSEPSHYIFFNKTTLEKTLELAGLTNISVKLDNMRFLSAKYILSRLQQMFLPNNKYLITNNSFDIPIPTDPFGDLVATEN